ncbi:hypothetical protein [Desulfurobacterium sp.]
MKLKELCKYCEWNQQGHCIMGNNNWKALMAENLVNCEDFEPVDLCSSCKRDCKESCPEARIVECPDYESF